MGLGVYHIWVWALLQEMTGRYSPQASPREELWTAIPWVHTHHLWRVRNVCPVNSGKQDLDPSALHHSGNIAHRRSYILIRCISQQKQLPCQWLAAIPIFFLIALFLTQAFQVMGNSHLQHLSNAFMCPSSYCIGQSKWTYLELFLFRKFSYVSLFALSHS